MNNALPCVILAGGLGTRLTPVTTAIPKPMVPVAGQPFLTYLLEQVRAAGCTDVVLCIGYRGQVIADYFGDGSAYGLRLRYSQEEQLRGTAGALALARALLPPGPFFVLNGDSYCPVDFAALQAHHGAHHAQATIVAAHVPDASSYGRLVIGADDASVAFEEKGQAAGPSEVNAGIYLLEPNVLKLIPPGQPYSLERDLFPRLTGRGLYAFRQAAGFLDIGTPATLAASQTLLPALHHSGLYAAA